MKLIKMTQMLVGAFALAAPAGVSAQATGGKALPAQLPPGKYSCLHIYYDFMQKRMATNMIGLLTILPGSQYRWFNGTVGRFKYDAASGAVKWLSGVYSQPEARSTVEWVDSQLMLKSEVPTGGKTITHRCYPQA